MPKEKENALAKLAKHEAEQDLLACIFQNPRAIGRVVDVLKPEDFNHYRTRLVYEVMLSLFAKGRRCSVENVWGEIERQQKTEEMGDLDDTGLFLWTNHLLQPIGEYVYQVVHYSLMRRLLMAGTKICNLAYNEDDNAIEEAEKLIYEVATSRRTKETVFLSEALDEYLIDLEQRIEDRKLGIARGIPTGFQDLDHLIGGMQPGTLYTLGALTGGGKSAWALNVAMNIVRNTKHALIFSLEMPHRQLVQRILSGEALVDQMQLRDAWIEEDQLQLLKQKAEDLRKCQLEFDDSSYLLADIKSTIRQSHSKKPLNLVIIDYLQLVKVSDNPRERRETRAEELGVLSRDMKRLSIELDIPIVVLVQLNRNVEQRRNPRPMLSDINESGNIARDSDVVMFLYTNPEDEEFIDSFTGEPSKVKPPVYRVYLDVPKNRGGATGEITLMFHSRITRFKGLIVPGDEVDDAEN